MSLPKLFQNKGYNNPPYALIPFINTTSSQPNCPKHCVRLLIKHPDKTQNQTDNQNQNPCDFSHF